MLEKAIAVLMCAVFGFFAARSIVAEADSHRWGRPDRWVGPICEGCGAPLGPLLVRCRGDHHRQRVGNVAVLATTVAAAALVPLVVPTLWVVPAYLAFVATSILLTVTDVDTQLIPNRMLLRGGGIAGGLLVVGGLLASEPGSVARSLLGAAAYFVVMLVLALLARGALGFGDVKLAALLGAFTAYLGWGFMILAGVSGFIIAGVVALVLLVLRLARRTDHIAFGPFMVAGAFVALYGGEWLIEWYTG